MWEGAELHVNAFFNLVKGLTTHNDKFVRIE